MLALLHRYVFFTIVILLLVFSYAQSAVKTSVTSGNWTTGATWGGSAPATTDTVIISSGHTVTLTGATTIRDVTVNSSGILSGSTFLLTVTGNYTVNGTHSGSGGVTLSGAGFTIAGMGSVTNSGTFTISASKTISSSATLSISGTIALSGTITVTNNGTITSSSTTGITGTVSGSTWVNAANSTLNVAGAILSTGTLTATASPNTINYNGTGANQTMKATTYHHLTITKGIRLATFAGSSTLNGNLTVVSGTLGITGITLTVNGTTTISGRITDTLSTTGTKTYVGLVTINSGGVWVNPQGEGKTYRGGIVNNGTFTSNVAGTCTFSTNNQTLSGSGSYSFYNLTISGAITLTNKTTVTVANNLAGSVAGSTWLNDTSATLNAGRAVLNTGTLIASAPLNTVQYNRGGNQTLRAVTYYNLIVAGSGTKTASGNITVNNNFTVSGSAVFASGTSFTHNFYGNWIINSSTATWFTFSTSNTINFNTPSTPAATSISGTNTSTIGFNSVNINNTSGFSTPRSFTATGTMTVVAGVIFTPSATATIGGAGTLTGAGTVQVTRTTATADFSTQYPITNKTLTNLTVEYTASGQTLSALTYGKLKISGSITSNTNSATVGSLLNVTGVFTSTGGTITMNNGSSITNSGTLTLFNLTTAASASVTSSGALTIAGAMTVGSSSSFVASSPITISGTSISNSGTLTFDDLTVSGTVTTSSSFTVGGNLTVSGSLSASSGTITMSGTSKTLSGAGTKTFSGLSITGTITTAQNFSLASSLSVTGSFTATAGDATITSVVAVSGSPNLFNVTLNNGTTLRPGANTTVGIAGALTLNTGTLDVTTNTPNTIQYNGSTAQSVVATKYHHLILSGGNTKTAAGADTVNGDVTIQSGTVFSAGSYSHTVYGNWTNSGSFTAGTSTVQFAGSADISITGVTIFNILTINKPTASDIVTLADSVITSTLNMTSGQLLTGTKSVTITSTRTGSAIILGTIRRTHAFSNSTAYEFEGQDNTLTFASGASNVSSITITVTSAALVGFPSDGSINRDYVISATTSGAYSATLRLHYEDAELNGNVESNISLWRYSGSWVLSGKTANDATNNWVEQSSLTNFTGRWTLSDDQNIVQWLGSLSTAWETSGNWSVVQGSPSMPPSSGDVVQLGTASITNQPTISSAASARSILFGSTSAVTLTLGSGGSLTTTGNISGTWSGNVTHAIAVQAQTLTVGGDLSLSDGTSGHDINLSVGRGSATISGSLTQSGNASISFSDTGSINIGRDFIRTAGSFTAGTGTVRYNGSVAQSVASGITYNHLVFNKTAGTATITSATTVNGNMTLTTAGIVQVNNTLTVGGNVTIGSGTTLNASTVTISVAGNWSKTGTFTAGTGTVTLNGSGAQAVNATTFNNFTVNKSSGTATLSASITLDGNLAVSAGTLDLASFTANRSSSGGSFTLSSGATLKLSGASNFPANFVTNSLASASTVEYNGSGVQTISPVTYGNLTLTNGGSNAKSLSGATGVSGDLLINSGATMNGSSQTMTLQGNWTNNGTFTSSTSTISLAGSSKSITGATSFYHLAVPGSYTATSAVTTTSTFNISGSFNAGATTTTVSGDFSNSGTYQSSGVTTFTGTSAQNLSLESGFTSTGTVNFNGTVAPTLTSLSSPTLFNLNVNNTGGIAPNIGWLVNGTCIIASGSSFAGGSNTHTFGGTFTNNGTVTSGGRMYFTPSSATTITLKGTAFTSTGVVEFGGTGLITLPAITLSLSSVTVSNTNASGVSIPAAWTLSGDLTIETNATLNCGTALSHTVSGDITNNGTLNGATSTFTMNGGSTIIGGSGSTTFNNITITGDVTVSSDINVRGNFTNNGTFDGTGNTVTFTGSGASTISGSANPTAFDQLAISKTSATTTLSINLNDVTTLDILSGTLAIGTRTISQIGTGGTLSISAGAKLTVGGASNFPVFDDYDLATTSIVEYNGTVTQTVSNAVTYGGLMFSNAGTKNIASGVTTTGDVTVNSGAPVTIATGFTFTVAGAFHNAGTLVNQGSLVVGP